MTDYKKKYEELLRQFESVEHHLFLMKRNEIIQERTDEQYDAYLEMESRLKPIKGLKESEVEILCDLLIEAKYLDDTQNFYMAFDPFYNPFHLALTNMTFFQFGKKKKRTNWNGSQADLLYMLDELGLTSQRHFYAIALILTIQGKAKTHTQLADHRKKMPKGTPKMVTLLKEYKKLITVS